MNDTEKTLTWLRKELRAVKGVRSYVIFGSTSLWLRGVIEREPGDIDVMATRAVWGRLLARKGWEVIVPRAGDPPILASTDMPISINAFYDWTKREHWMEPEPMLKSYEKVKGWRVVPLQLALKHKEDAIENLKLKSVKIKKHEADIAQIEAMLNEGGYQS